MRVDKKDGGDGVACWNTEAVRSYAAEIDADEARLARDNPDVVVTSGLFRCYGCEKLEWEDGTRCTAELTLTLYRIKGQVAPRSADASASLQVIPGLRSRILDDEAVAAPETATATTPPSRVSPAAPSTSPKPLASAKPTPWKEPPEAEPRKTGLRGLLGRKG